MSTSAEHAAAPTLPDHVLHAVAQALDGLRFGQVTIIVQDGRVIQIDRTERRRFASKREDNRSE
jgi:hypothetical protein